MHGNSQYNSSLHKYAVVLVCMVVGLISAGALVTSTGAGLSVPDWPTSYGGINPPNWWRISTVRAEHGHRLIAGTIGLMTIFLAVWIHRAESRDWVKRLAWAALATVVVQAFLGGTTVLFYLPTAISVAHAGTAQLFLCLVTLIAVVTSKSWIRLSQELWPTYNGDRPRRITRWLPFAVYAQVLVGAIMRHSGAGLAIPDFPLVFGGLLPSDWSFPIAIHYLHRVGALVVGVWIVMAWLETRRGGETVRGVVWPTWVLLVLLATQITLGALVVLSGKAPLPNTIHVTVGASIFAVSILLAANTAVLFPRRVRSAPANAASQVA